MMPENRHETYLLNLTREQERLRIPRETFEYLQMTRKLLENAGTLAGEASEAQRELFRRLIAEQAA
jgi:hypothetical protein